MTEHAFRRNHPARGPHEQKCLVGPSINHRCHHRCRNNLFAPNPKSGVQENPKQNKLYKSFLFFRRGLDTLWKPSCKQRNLVGRQLLDDFIVKFENSLQQIGKIKKHNKMKNWMGMKKYELTQLNKSICEHQTTSVRFFFQQVVVNQRSRHSLRRKPSRFRWKWWNAQLPESTAIFLNCRVNGERRIPRSPGTNPQGFDGRQ